MKLKRNGMAITALALSAVVFMGTALADTLIGSGYDSLKDSIKQTAAEMESDVASFTFESMYVIKDNGNKLLEQSDVFKSDNKNNQIEKISTDAMKGTTNYYYQDLKSSVSKSSQADKYFVGDGGRNSVLWSNPFKEEHYSDMEKIFDAAVGGLKDNVQVEEATNGGKIYSGSITQTQVPTLINAIASFGIKQSTRNVGRDEYSIPQMKNDIFIQNVSGKALVDPSGRINSIVGEVAFNGNDANGATHQLSIEIIFTLKDINATLVQKPDLTGKLIEKISSNRINIDDKYVGTYKTNIIIEENNQFIKISERVLTIAHADDEAIAGNFKEVYKAGYESYEKDKLDFNFEASPQQDAHQMQFSYTRANGEIAKGNISRASMDKLYLYLENQFSENFDNEFSRVYED